MIPMGVGEEDIGVDRSFGQIVGHQIIAERRDARAGIDDDHAAVRARPAIRCRRCCRRISGFSAPDWESSPALPKNESSYRLLLQILDLQKDFGLLNFLVNPSGRYRRILPGKPDGFQEKIDIVDLGKRVAGICHCQGY